MGDVLNIVGLVGSALLMIPFLIPNTPDPTLPARTTNIRIGSGISAVPGENEIMMGSFPGLALFDVQGNKLGQTAPSKSDMNTYQDIKIVADADVKDTEPEYLSLSTGKHPICITYITVSTPEAVKYTWIGDVAKSCGLPWYYTENQTLAINAQNVMPVCLWLQTSGEHGTTKVVRGPDPLIFQGMGIHIKDFSSPSSDSQKAAMYNKMKDTLCRSAPRFWLYEHLTPDDYIPYYVGGTRYNMDGTDQDLDLILNGQRWNTSVAPPVVDETVPWINYQRRGLEHPPSVQRRRSEHINANILPTHLVTSRHELHSAIELCNDSSSAGPDFVSHSEKVFCDMANKRTYPLCVSDSDDECFDLEATMLRPGAIVARNFVVKRYNKVREWH